MVKTVASGRDPGGITAVVSRTAVRQKSRLVAASSGEANSHRRDDHGPAQNLPRIRVASSRGGCDNAGAGVRNRLRRLAEMIVLPQAF